MVVIGSRYALPIDSLGFGFIVKAMEGADDVGDAPEDGAPPLTPS